MSKQIGMVVCTFNKKDFVLNCVQSIFDSNAKDFDVIVVDNASSDGTYEALTETFGDRIIILRNSENLGGSGGFNTGLRYALEQGYPYLMCVDDDIRFDADAIPELKSFLDTHPDVGMVGSKICKMDTPDRLQTMGGMIDFEKFELRQLHESEKDDDSLPEVEYVDMIHACSLMMKRETLLEVGLMQQDFFLYWDDDDWGMRFNAAGYKVASISASRVWHKRGNQTMVTNFNRYYAHRNRIVFFMKYLPADRREAFAKHILRELYTSCSAIALKGDDNMLHTMVYAFDDAIHHVMGKAPEYKVPPLQEVTRLRDLVQDAASIRFILNGDFVALGRILENIRKINERFELILCVRDCPDARKEAEHQYPQAIVSEQMDKEADITLKLCTHIFEVEDITREGIYIDPWCNLLLTEEEFRIGRSHKENQELFVKMWLPVVMGAME